MAVGRIRVNSKIPLPHKLKNIARLGGGNIMLNFSALYHGKLAGV